MALAGAARLRWGQVVQGWAGLYVELGPTEQWMEPRWMPIPERDRTRCTPSTSPATTTPQPKAHLGDDGAQKNCDSVCLPVTVYTVVSEAAWRMEVELEFNKRPSYASPCASTPKAILWPFFGVISECLRTLDDDVMMIRRRAYTALRTLRDKRGYRRPSSFKRRRMVLSC